MSVIIRLQNLPWSANAADIRAYFTGLSIPEGGVHIVGGEQGDAFIAFSTDEDARQAMLRDGGKLKEVKIKLFLSSRTEMLRIIEQARQQTLNLQSIIQGNIAQPVVPAVNQPISNVTYESVESKENIKEDDSDKGRDDDDYHRDRRDRRDRDRSGSRDRGRSSDKDRSRDRDRDRDRGRYNRDRDRERRRRDRSKSRDRYRRRSRSRDRARRSSRDKDGRNKRRDSEQDSDEKQRTTIVEVPEPTPPPQQHWEPVSIQQPKQALLPDPVLPPMMMQMQQAGKEMTPPQQPLIGFQDQDRRPMGFPQQMLPQAMPYQGVPMRGRENWCGPMNNMGMPVMGSEAPAQCIPTNRHTLHPQNEMSVPKYPQTPYGMGQQFIQTGKDTNSHWAGPGLMQNTDDGQNDVCIEIRGLPLNATYVDVKRLFDGLTIPPDGIKMINDNQGNRTGIAYVKFTQQAHKKHALNQNGKKVRSSIVEVLHLRESIYNIAVDNFKPEKDVTLKSDDMEIDNGDNSEDVAWKRDGETKKANYQDPRIANKNSKSSGKNAEGGRRDKIKSDCVLIKGVPHSSMEPDIIDFFSPLQIAPLEIFIVCDAMGQRVGDAFCKFKSFDEAEKATTKSKTSLGRHIVTIFLVPSEDMDRAKSYCMEPHIPQYVPQFMPMRGGYNPMQYKPRMPGDGMGNDYFMEGDRPRMGFGNRFMMGDMGERPMMGRGERPMMGRGRPMMPGMQNMRPPRRPPRSTSPYIDGDSLEHFGKPGCVVALENIHFKADIDEIMEFFQGFKIEHEDVIRRFDESGRPTGDARVALKNPAEAMRAVRQLSFKTIRGRPIKVSIVQ
ncbi:hypothetical protein AAG570_012168 [Ranatra chinensis]|uniref:RRM domain-containing protein n=1 Tax=Ranatra chinensis TaxID=642074 RepID=A0ABD0YWH2_9HEMI